jgi:hypothetical protein
MKKTYKFFLIFIFSCSKNNDISNDMHEPYIIPTSNNSIPDKDESQYKKLAKIEIKNLIDNYAEFSFKEEIKLDNRNSLTINLNRSLHRAKRSNISDISINFVSQEDNNMQSIIKLKSIF